ncbi:MULTISPECIES: RelA/SpoT domain-containing protein [Sphingomonadaceae]|jgi:ppGpp synthetase/RelA/SpoT-type nucleotidyltranferase|uniref:RelA/SpoT domain-containing protein n=3 Tax=Sphingomonadaceae TaxID=41297 RepID=A0A084EF64_SPHYA|nr:MULTISPECIES: RelA/SpoT domain-containing protein [Sphingomonadaceae]MCC4253909.1 RelA/SpoT domain-containing protein [Sphingobium naphthae]KEZ16606.1 hypothetical protein CP98_04034 [Sphingobium yanoikuyae]MDG5973207.1 hypothetical protein [Sphingomonas paucimobilis]MDK8186638.1 RelA/SpoT domain-containing protein [Sphingomonas zeae]MDK8216267.1 RelA/SpoT domain-containing protein [Sphingomonas sp. UMB7805-LC452B]|tara:strand:- start:3247 stop:6234 length:2988 start_codon:yes stop_codon:yes gene_type:complete
MTFEEYQQDGRTRYLALVDAIQNILQHMLIQHGLMAHTITGRAKEVGSLAKKLKNRGIDPADAIDERLKDLAGCRVVFLTNSQVEAFNHTGALHENFEVLDVNVHHPVPGTDTETKLFDSTNYLVCLKPERLALPEYRAFAGLRAEIQIQTLLNHAWAEMGHDTIYKEPNLKHLGAARMADIGERMNRVMQAHLVPAGHDFDKIASDFRRLVQADGAVDAVTATIVAPQDNNALEDALETYADLVLPHYDDPAAHFLEMFEALITAVERSRDFPVVPIETSFGALPGNTSIQVARRVKDLISAYRHCDAERTFQALICLYMGAWSEEERHLWIELGEKLTKHDLAIWERFGAAAQQVVLDGVASLTADETQASRPLLVAMLKEVLSPDLGGTSWKSDAVIFHQGVVPASDHVRDLRTSVIDWLEKWLDESTQDKDRLKILCGLREACAAPAYGNFDAGLAKILLDDTSRVCSIMTARAAAWGLELRRWCEVDALHTHYRYHVLRPDLAEMPDLVAAQKAAVDALLSLRDLLNADAEFFLYKTLIGHDTVRPAAWDGDHFDYQATDAWRAERYAVIVEEITPPAVADWMTTLYRFIEAVGSDGGHLTPLRNCMHKLAREKPDVAILMLDGIEATGTAFLAQLLVGLDEAGRNDAVDRHFDAWLETGAQLPGIGDYLRLRAAPDPERLAAYVARAVADEDEQSIIAGATTAAVWYDREADQLLIERGLMPTVDFFTARTKPSWIKQFWTPGNAKIVQALSAGEAERFLASFVSIEGVGHRDVRLLAAIAPNFPDQVIDFFGTRIRHGRQTNRRRFDAVPFDAHDLPEVLSPHVDLLIPAIRDWHAENSDWHEYCGGRLFRHAFPELSAAVSEKLIEIAREGSNTDLEFILKTLTTYEGDEGIYPVCMEVVDRLEPGANLLENVSRVLGATGVLTGEFGHVQAYAERKQRIDRWKDDPRPRVKAYAVSRSRELEQSMAWEQRRASQGVAQRKRAFGEE